MSLIDFANHKIYTHASIPGTTHFANDTISPLGYYGTKDKQTTQYQQI